MDPWPHFVGRTKSKSNLAGQAPELFMVDATIPLHTNLLVLETQEEWIAKLEGLVEEHGLSTVENWCDERDKHNHHLIHLAVHRNATQVIKVMVS